MSDPSKAARADEILRAETARFEERTPRSRELYERAAASMPFGVASSFQAGDPYPIYLTGGRGSRVTDVDGHESSTSTTASRRWRWDTRIRACAPRSSTLRYRVRQAEDLMGRDLGSAEDRMEIWLALKAMEVLDR